MATTMAGTKTSFLRGLDWPADLTIEWIGDTGFVTLDADRRAVITIVTRGTADHYTGLQVEIISKTAGPIDRRYLGFDDFLQLAAGSRTDHTARDGRAHFEVIVHCGWRWYISQPGSTAPVCDAAAAYIRLFE
jgi:hypothetical protein